MQILIFVFKISTYFTILNKCAIPFNKNMHSVFVIEFCSIQNELSFIKCLLIDQLIENYVNEIMFNKKLFANNVGFLI